MLCKLQNVKKLCLAAGFLPNLFITMTAFVWAPTAKAQASTSERTEGIISGTVLLKEGNRRASKVAVKQKSHAAGLIRRLMTDYECYFEERTLSTSKNEFD